MMLLKLSMLCAMLALSSAYPKGAIDEGLMQKYNAETEDMDNYLSEVEAESLTKAKMEAAMPQDPKLEDFADTEQLAPAGVILYPFGAIVGDSTLGASDDRVTSRIAIPPFRFFGVSRTGIYVSNNGILTFVGPETGFTPRAFNSVSRPIIAPYWADVDARSGGQVVYRSTNNLGLRQRAGREISLLFPNQARFLPTSLFITTLPSVKHFNHATATRRNTLQSILATDGTRSYVFFQYADIQWTTGDASGGNNGLGGTEAAIGLGAGDGQRHVTVPQSFTPAVVDIEETGNTGLRGVYVWRVDGAAIQQPPVCSNV